MYSFLLSVCALILGYILYGKIVDRVFGPDPSRTTPAIRMQDGVDYIPMPTWKVFMIQFLNIAGTGPVFGAIMGAKFGPASYLWIVFGCIFGGAVHDYLSGMLSLRKGGASLSELVGHYLGRGTKNIMAALMILLLLMVGAVFVYSPSSILSMITGGGNSSFMIFVVIILSYYLVATLMPIDKIIGRIYPLFAIALIFMAVGMFASLLVRWPGIPEFWQGLDNRTGSVGVHQSMFPYMFITIACGAVSGFHATQSPMMARCLKNEKLGRPIFYGAMITEGLVALVWAAVSSYFFFDGGMAEVGATASDAPAVVASVSKSWLGVFGGVLALLGVVAAPITTGDTALRSLRMIIADLFHIDQKNIGKRLAVSAPIFALTGLLLWYNIADAEGFNTIWKYFGWANQALSCFTLWALTVFLKRERSGCKYLMAAIPAVFMTVVCTSYIFMEIFG